MFQRCDLGHGGLQRLGLCLALRYLQTVQIGHILYCLELGHLVISREVELDVAVKNLVHVQCQAGLIQCCGLRTLADADVVAGGIHHLSVGQLQVHVVFVACPCVGLGYCGVGVSDHQLTVGHCKVADFPCSCACARADVVECQLHFLALVGREVNLTLLERPALACGICDGHVLPFSAHFLHLKRSLGCEVLHSRKFVQRVVECQSRGFCSGHVDDGRHQTRFRCVRGVVGVCACLRSVARVVRPHVAQSFGQCHVLNLELAQTVGLEVLNVVERHSLSAGVCVSGACDAALIAVAVDGYSLHCGGLAAHHYRRAIHCRISGRSAPVHCVADCGACL